MPDGKIWLMLCVASVSGYKHSGYLEIHRKGSNEYWRYLLTEKKWKACKRTGLKEHEKDVLRLSAQGYTTKEIASLLFKSVDTIKSYKRSLFEKLKVNHITEAISHAVNKKII